MPTLSYAIVGTGAIGGYYGGRLQQAGCDVHFLLRSDYQQVQTSGLRIGSIDGNFVLPQVNAYNSAVEIPPVDVVIVALKTTQNHRLWELLPQIKPGGALLSLQNGLGIEDAMAQQLREKNLPVPTILGGLCFICANKVGPGEIQHSDYGQILLGAHSADQQAQVPTPLMKSIEADFCRVGVSIKMTEDLFMARWQKLVWNVPYNGLSVVLNATTEEMMANRSVRSLITTLMTEVVAIANAWGEHTSPGTRRTIPINIITKMLTHTETMPPYRTSMKMDYDAARPLEIETILGNPLKAAQTLNIPAPSMNMLYQQLGFLDRTNSSV